MQEKSFDVECWTLENYWALADLLGPYYMDRRIQSSGLVWGKGPTHGAEKALSIFQKHGVKQVLDIGCGYGRDGVFFAKHGLHVTGVEYSKKACSSAEALYQSELAIAKKEAKEAKKELNWGSFHIAHADFRSWDCSNDLFDAAFSFKTFHQFRLDLAASQAQEKKGFSSASTILNRMTNFIKPGGLLVISMFSTKDDYFGRGKYIENDTFDIRGHRSCAFYTEERLRDLLKSLAVQKLELIEYKEDHPPDGEHWHRMWLAIATKV